MGKRAHARTHPRQSTTRHEPSVTEQPAAPTGEPDPEPPEWAGRELQPPVCDASLHVRSDGDESGREIARHGVDGTAEITQPSAADRYAVVELRARCYDNGGQVHVHPPTFELANEFRYENLDQVAAQIFPFMDAMIPSAIDGIPTGVLVDCRMRLVSEESIASHDRHTSYERVFRLEIAQVPELMNEHDDNISTTTTWTKFAETRMSLRDLAAFGDAVPTSVDRNVDVDVVTTTHERLSRVGTRTRRRDRNPERLAIGGNTPQYEPEVVDTDAAANIVGLAPTTLATLRSRGNGPPFVKLGKAVRYRVADLREWRDARRRYHTR